MCMHFNCYENKFIYSIEDLHPFLISKGTMDIHFGSQKDKKISIFGQIRSVRYMIWISNNISGNTISGKIYITLSEHLS